MEKLLYIGHAYHNKTQSTRFLKDLLATKYEVTTFDFDPYNDSYDVFSTLQGTYDVVVIFQMMTSVNLLKKNLKCRHFVFFPMYDGVPPINEPIWQEYIDVKIINFSKTLHERCQKAGFDSKYIQYFPKPIDITNQGDDRSVFFWQRIEPINLNTVKTLLEKSDIKHLHLHKAMDPTHRFLDHKMPYSISTSEWFDTREKMQCEMQKHAIYIAPRLYEGIGMSFLEAMAMGRCVIAPDNPTMNEYISDGKTGYLYDPNNVKPITLTDVKQIQENAFHYIQAGYKTWEKDKYQILTWVAAGVHSNKRKIKKLKKNEHAVTLKLFGFLPLYKKTTKSTSRKYYIFGIPFIKITEK